MVEMDDPVAVGLSLGGTGPCSRNGTAFRYGSVAGAMGGFGYRCYRYSLCLCQPYRSQFDIELKAKEFGFLAFQNHML